MHLPAYQGYQPPLNSQPMRRMASAWPLRISESAICPKVALYWPVAPLASVLIPSLGSIGMAKVIFQRWPLAGLQALAAQVAVLSRSVQVYIEKKSSARGTGRPSQFSKLGILLAPVGPGPL